MLELMCTVISSLQVTADAIADCVMTNDKLLQHLKTFMLDLAQFTAGNLSIHVVAYKFLLEFFGTSAKSQYWT